MTKIIYKCLGKDRQAIYGLGSWPEVGTWTETQYPDLCRSGWHLTTGSHVLRWLAEELYIAEAHPEAIHDSQQGDTDKFAVSQARLVRQLPWNSSLADVFHDRIDDKIIELSLSIAVFDSRAYYSADWPLAIRTKISRFKAAYFEKHLTGLHLSAAVEGEAEEILYAIFKEIVFAEDAAQ